MSAPILPARLLESPWSKAFHELLSKAGAHLLLASPYIKRSKVWEVLAALKQRNAQDKVQVLVLTDVRPESSLVGATDLQALLDLSEGLGKVIMTHLPSLHAKVYVADRNMAIVTSGNLTDSGVSGNIEYGVVFKDRASVDQIRRDFEGYALLGAKLLPDELRALVEEIQELKLLYQKAEQSIRARARRAFREKLRATHRRILRHRAAGRTTNSILSESILFLLAKCPLRTEELHPLIQQLHPDICDDSIELVIEGMHFGKKWKHHVRNAQQYLKREGQIRYDGVRWHLVP